MPLLALLLLWSAPPTDDCATARALVAVEAPRGQEDVGVSLAKAFGVACEDPTQCKALDKALGFRAERAAVFAPGTATWLVSERTRTREGEYADRGRVHIYDAASRKRRGVVPGVRVVGPIDWVDERCALVSLPQPSSGAWPQRLWCGRGAPVRLSDDSGSNAHLALSRDRLALWNAESAWLRVVAMPSGKLVYERAPVDTEHSEATMALMPDGRIALATSDPAKIWLLDARDGSIVGQCTK